MKLSIKPRFGCVCVRGGQILVVHAEHAVPTSGYDASADQITSEGPRLASSQPTFQRRTFDDPWVTAKVDDLAIEVISVKTEVVLGYAYIGGGALNLIRYVSDRDRETARTWFTPGKGIRFNPIFDIEGEQFVHAMSVIKHGDAHLAACQFRVTADELIEPALTAIAHASAHASPDPDQRWSTHILAKVISPKQVGTIHHQPLHHAGPFACQPFFHDLVHTSPHLQEHAFLPTTEPS